MPAAATWFTDLLWFFLTAVHTALVDCSITVCWFTVYCCCSSATYIYTPVYVTTCNTAFVPYRCIIPLLLPAVYILLVLCYAAYLPPPLLPGQTDRMEGHLHVITGLPPRFALIAFGLTYRFCCAPFVPPR